MFFVLLGLQKKYSIYFVNILNWRNKFYYKHKEIVGMNKTKGIILLLISSLIWGTAYIPTRYLGSQNVGVFFELLVRYAFPLVIFAVLAFKDIRKTDRVSMKKYMLTGVVLFLALALAVYGVRTITYGSMGLLLISLNTIFVPLYLVIAKKQKVAKTLILASIMSMCGVFLLTLDNFKIKIELGFILCILASVCFSAYIILGSKILKGTNAKPSVLQFYQSLVFVVLCSVLVLTDIKSVRAIDFSNINIYIALAFIGVLAGTMAYYLYFYALKITDPTTVGVLLDSQIIFSVVSEVIIFKMNLTTTQIIAYLMVIVAIFLVSFRSIRKS